MPLESRAKRDEVDRRKMELGEVKNDPNISPAERSAVIKEIDDLEREALAAEAEAGESTVQVIPARPEEEDSFETSTPVTEAEAEENRDRIAEEDTEDKSDEELVEGATEFVQKAGKDPKEAAKVEKSTEAKAEKAASKSRAKK